MTLQGRIAEIAKKATGPALKRGYLAEDYDGIGSTTTIKLSTGSSSAVIASVAAGAFGTEQTAPAGTVVTVVEYQGRLEIVSLGSKLGATAIKTDMLSPDLQVADESGNPTITPLGFTGTWSELIADGVYNSRFSVGIPGVLPDGQTANLPYWSIHRSGNAVAELVVDSTWPGGNYVKCSFSAIFPEWLVLQSNPVPVTGGFEYGIAVYYDADVNSSEFQLSAFIKWFDSAGVDLAVDSTTTSESVIFGPAATINTRPTALPLAFATGTAPGNAAYAAVGIQVYQLGAYDATAFLQLGAVDFRKVAYAIDRNSTLGTNGSIDAGDVISFNQMSVEGRLVLTPVTESRNGGTFDWNPGADFAALIVVDNTAGANINLHSLVMDNMPIQAGRVIMLANISTSAAETITLMHASASASDPNTRFFCPNNANYVLKNRGGVWLVYTSVNAWIVLDNL